MRRYDYSFIRDLKISAGMMSLTNKMEVFRLKEEERKTTHPETFEALRKIARVLSVKGSNAIEGILTTDDRIEEILNGNSAPRNHNEMEIAGYRDVLDRIHREHGSMVLTEDLITSMHRAMMSYTPRGGGYYKEDDNIIVNIDENGMRRIRFVPVPAEETSKAMEQLILAYRDARDDAGIDPLLLIPCFILDFLCIHPFSDGNGRMSRLLTLLLLYKSGMDAGKYISFEEKINEYKDRYYDALRRSSDGWHANNNDYVPFAENFIFTLFSCYKELDRRFAVIGGKKANKGNRIEAAVMNSTVPISKKEIAGLLPDISQTTIEAKLSALQREKKIKKIGGSKDARYIKGP
jgi:Fic family protein